MDDCVTESESVVPSLNPNPTNKIVEEEEEEEEKDKSDGVAEAKEVKMAADSGRGGFINHLISNLTSQSREVEVEDTVTKEGKTEQVESASGDGGGGGIINKLISNYFHKSEGNENEEKNEEVDEGKEGKAEEGGGGLIHNLVSHLPVSLPDAAAPATDEASILIHSIIHD